MKIIFDISTPKQVTFFKPMIDELKNMGVSLFLISRDYTELNLLIDNFNLKTKVIGKHGGSSLFGKLKYSAERVALLAKYFHKIKPDVVVTLSNPESSRAAFGLNIPIICFNDAPESQFVSKLTLPLAKKVCAPWLIPRKDFARYGVSPEKIYYYKALDPLIWLEKSVPESNYYKNLGLSLKNPIIVCRETEWQSSYENHDTVTQVIKQLRRDHPDWQIIDIPRYRKHKYYDTASLLSFADLFIGGGGTMCIEAAYYGTPVIATRLLNCYYMEWLFKKGLALKTSNTSEAVKLSEKIIENHINNISQAKKSIRNMHFPVSEICNLIISTSQHS